MSAPPLDSARLFRRLREAGVDFVVIGGFAAVVRGVPHVTEDVDICYAADQENRRRLVKALAPLHPRPSAAGLTDSIAVRLRSGGTP